MDFLEFMLALVGLFAIGVGLICGISAFVDYLNDLHKRLASLERVREAADKKATREEQIAKLTSLVGPNNPHVQAIFELFDR